MKKTSPDNLPHLNATLLVLTLSKIKALLKPRDIVSLYTIILFTKEIENVMKNFIYIPLALLALIASCRNKTQPGPETYFSKVKTIISNNCMSCHNSVDVAGWQGRPIKFDTDIDITTSYAVIKASVADPASPLNRRMPPSGSLPVTDVDIIVKWFNKGGKSTD